MNKKLNVFSILIVFVCFFCVSVSLTACSDTAVEDDFITLSELQSDSIVETETGLKNKLCVYITGAVKKPGVYTLDKGSRLYELIELAGGFSKDAKRDYLNLAGELSDGIHINVLTNELYEAYEKDNPSKITEDASDNTDNGNKIDINRAGLSELTSLPGIGEVRANAIISYRNEQGDFQKIEDVMNVNGIGESLYSRIKDLICVE